MREPSLALRVIAYLVVAQLIAFFIAWIVTIGLGLAEIGIFKTSLDELDSYRVGKLVIQSLVRDADGAVRIEPIPELLAEVQRAPSMKFAAFDTVRNRALPGSSPELAAALAGVIEISPTHTHFVLPSDPRTTPLGLMEPKSTRFGTLHIAVYGQKFRWDDLFHAMQEELQWLAVYIVAAILMSAGTARFAVTRGLTPLRSIAAEATRIDMTSLHQRLSSNGVTSEIRPLVDAMNDALRRLDADAARQRRFTANAAHELRTPVAILSARLDAPEEPTFKNDLKRDARRIRNIVEQLLASARLAERPDESVQDVDLVPIVQAMVGDAALFAIKSGRQIAFEAPRGPIRVRGSRRALESVVTNLVDNALHVEPEGGTILVRVAPGAKVVVIDHGEGVSPCDRELIFEPFWRKTDAKPGTGLGLAIARELMDLHGGCIRVRETPGGGATFEISLPEIGPSAHR